MIIVIIPIYNESKVIYKLLQNEEFKKYKLLLVDDGSTESLSLSEIKMPFYFLQHRKNLGQGAALQTGMEFARSLKADIIVHFDADGQHDPYDIEKLIEPIIVKKANVVIGSRFLNPQKSINTSDSFKIPFRKKIILRCARIVQFIFTGITLSDSQMGLRAISGSVLQSIKITENRMTHAIELIQIFKEKKLLIEEVFVNIEYTAYTNKKGQKLINGLFIIVRLFINKLITHVQFSAVFLTVIISALVWYFNKNENLLFMTTRTILIYLFNLIWILIARKTKLQSIATTQIIRNETILNAKEFNCS